MTTEGLMLLLFNVVGGAAMWFLKDAYNEQRQKIKELEQSLDRVRDTYFKKEDFREFKDELWTKLEKIEVQVQKKFQG